MTPGPTLIMKAPGCKTPVKFSTIASGNTLGATFWTDGKCEAPMLPDNPWLRKHPSEGVLFWSDECVEIGQICAARSERITKPRFWSKMSLARLLSPIKGSSGRKPSNPEWGSLDYAMEPTEADYTDAIDSEIITTREKLIYIRTRLWWKGNDRIRRKESSELSDKHIQNLHELASFFHEHDPYQRLLKAEIFRELSRFDDAMSLLEWDFSDNYQRMVNRIRDLAVSHKSWVDTL